MTTYRINGTFPPGCDGYHLSDYAGAACVALDGYATEAEARAAADKIEATPDTHGTAPTCDVVESTDSGPDTYTQVLRRAVIDARDAAIRAEWALLRHMAPRMGLDVEQLQSREAVAAAVELAFESR
jgi:hypothetical protein